MYLLLGFPLITTVILSLDNENSQLEGKQQNQACIMLFLCFKEQLDIITEPKEMDPGITTWKGAGILSCLETAQELWISRGEWQRCGVRILRERTPFLW